VAGISLILKPDKEIARIENYSPRVLFNINVRILKTLAN